MQVDFELTRDDLWQFTKFIQFRTPIMTLSFVGAACQYALIFFFVNVRRHPPTTLLLLFTAFFAAIGILGFMWVLKTKTVRGASERGGQLGKRTLVMSSEGIRETTTNSEEFCRWKGVLEFAETASFIYLFTDNYRAFTVPIRAFASPADARTFREVAMSYWRDATAAKP